MATFRYLARARDGRRLEGCLEAADRHAALAELARMDCVPVRVEEAAAVELAPSAGRFRLRRRASPPRMATRQMLQFTRELSDLVGSGMTLGEALHALARRGGGGEAATAVISDLRDQIVQGRSLSDALAAHPATFPPLYVSMVRAGEAAGTLAASLERLAAHFERAQETREKILMALTYPGIVLLVGSLTVVFIMVFVIPRFASMFAELGSTLPLPTRILIGLSRSLTGVRGLILIAAILLAVIAARRGLATEAGREWWHRTQLRLPVIGRVVRAAAFAQFAQTLGSLLANGVPVLSALTIVERTIGNRVIAREIRQARERVTDGSTISRPLAAGKVFPTLLTDMLAVGERTGDMPGALAHIARRYEAELDRTLKLFITILEPALIVAIATLVGFVAISMLAAVFDLTSGLRT
ncbi:MAG: type II secretion system F family protein [Kiritimatiellae bacterium]|nr:type II secretion system F family protein [Kiritimatiellia bacterium]